MTTHKHTTHPPKISVKRGSTSNNLTNQPPQTADHSLDHIIHQVQRQLHKPDPRQVLALQRTIGNRAAHQLLRPTITASRRGIQRYLTYNPTVGNINVVGYGANSTFNAQQSVGGSFMNPATQAPRIRGNPNGNNTPVRISQNGVLAVEDANLSNRQPKYFFADPAQLNDWNEALQANGSNFQLIQNGAETLQFTLNGVVKNLTRIDVQNLGNNTSGNMLTLAQVCDQTIKEVIGPGANPKAVFAQLPAILFPNQQGYQTIYEDLRQYFIADELVGGGTAGTIDLQNNPGNLPTQQEQIAQQYGTAQHQDQTGATPNPAMRNREQQLGVNQFASPDVGQGIVIHRLGSEIGGVVQDYYNNRTENNPSNQTLWLYHWGGVIAKDGTDYITLENYARGSEDNLGAVSNDPRFYFQMYGTGNATSWHDQWSQIGGGRNFVNPLTMTVEGELPPAGSANEQRMLNSRADKYYSGNVNAIADDYGTVAAVTTANQFMIALQKALAFARSNGVGDRAPNNLSRTHAWITALALMAQTYPQYASAHTYTVNQLTNNVNAKFDLDAQASFGGAINVIKDRHYMVTNATSPQILGRNLRKGLFFANHHIQHNLRGKKRIVNAWRNAVQNAPVFPETNALRAYTLNRLMTMRRTWF